MTTQPPTLSDLPPQQSGESDDAYFRRVAKFFTDDARSKVDLREWTGSLPFHLDKPE